MPPRPTPTPPPATPLSQRLSLALSMARMGVWDLDLDTLRLEWDATTEEIFGFAPGTFPGTQEAAASRTHPEDFAKILAERNRAIETRTDFRCEYRVLWPDGTERWVSSTGHAVYDERGVARRMSGVVMDVTERRRLEAEARKSATQLASQRDLLAQQAELFRTLADSLPAAIVYIDAEERYRFSNRYYEERYGRRRDQLIGRPLSAILGEEQYAKIKPHLARVMAGESVYMETELARPGEPTLWVNATYVPDVGPDGRVRGFAAISEDITERKRAEERLVASERQLQHLAEVIPQIVWVNGADGRVSYLNRRWYEFTGLQRGEIGAETWQRVVHPDDVEGVLRAFARIRSEDGANEFEFRLRRRDGAWRWFLARTVAVGSDSGSPYTRFGTATDIHDQKVAEQRQRLLASATSALTSTRDLRGRLERAAHFGLDLLGTWCAVYVGAGDDLELVAAAHRDPGRVPLVRELHERFGSRPELPNRVRDTLRSGVSDLLPHVPLDLVKQAVPAEQFALMSELGIRSTLCVPLRTGAEPWGVLSFVSSDATFDRADLELAEEFARHVAWAIDNARLFERQERSLALLQAFLKSAPVGMAFLDRELRYALVNQELADINGAASIDHMLGKTQWDVVPDLAPKVLPLLRRVLETGEPILGREVQGETPHAPGQQRAWLVSYYPVRSPLLENGAVLGVGAVILEITEQKAAQHRLEQAVRTRDEFLATLSHELRTPLTAMLGYTSMLRAGALPPDRARHALEVVERNVRSQARLIEDLLDSSRIITGKMRLELRQTFPRQVIEAVLDSLRPAATAKALDVRASFTSDVDAIIADPGRLQQVVWNLLSNAIKFTPQGGTIRVQLERRGDVVELSVSDNGRGIPAEFLPHVFERFRQADASTTRSYGGLGIGLSIVKHLVELHGGTVRAESGGEGRGATVVVQLPLLAAGLTEEDAQTRRLESLPARPSRLADLSGLQVLVVEDEADARELLCTVLESCGAEVRAVSGVAEALEELRRAVPDVLLSDIGLKGEDGYELIRRTRAMLREKVPRLPAIALTAFAAAQDRTRALLAGFNQHIAKPIDPAELVATIVSVCGERFTR